MNTSLLCILLLAGGAGAGAGLLLAAPLNRRLGELQQHQRLQQRLAQYRSFSPQIRAEKKDDQQPSWATIGLLLGPSNPAEVQSVRQKLWLAGHRQEPWVGGYYFLKFGGVLLVILITSLLWLRHLLPAPAILISAVPVLLAPDLFLKISAGRRQQRVLAALPDFIDLCNISMTAGLGWLISVKRVIEELQESHPEICSEFNHMFDQIQTGMARQQALRQLALRNPSKEIQYLVTILIQNDRMGSSVMSSLSDFSKRIYTMREQAMEEQAGKMSAKMALIILPFLLVPFMLLLVSEQMVGLVRMLSR